MWIKNQISCHWNCSDSHKKKQKTKKKQAHQLWVTFTCHLNATASKRERDHQLSSWTQHKLRAGPPKKSRVYFFFSNHLLIIFASHFSVSPFCFSFHLFLWFLFEQRLFERNFWVHFQPESWGMLCFRGNHYNSQSELLNWNPELTTVQQLVCSTLHLSYTHLCRLVWKF